MNWNDGWGTAKEAALWAVLPGVAVTDAVVGPSKVQREAVETLRAKWIALDAWGAIDRVPTIKPQRDTWREFIAKWDKEPTYTGSLEGLVMDVQVAENVASDKGYPGEFKPDGKRGSGNYGDKSRAQAPPVDETSLAHDAADKFSKKHPVDLGDGPLGIPMKYIYIAGAVLGLVVLGPPLASMASAFRRRP
jgi:hypothetical protein